MISVSSFREKDLRIAYVSQISLKSVQQFERSRKYV